MSWAPQLSRVVIGAGEYVDWNSATATVMALNAEILRLHSELADARRAGWIAGRDAALEAAREQVFICDAGIDEGDFMSQFYREGASRCCDAIRNMEPPA